MNAALGALLPQVQAALLVGFVVFCRVGAMLALLPGFGEQVLPVRIRLVGALAFTLVVAPAVADRIGPLTPLWQAMPRMLATETVAGLCIGMALRIMLMALETTGAIIAQSVSLAQLFGAAGAEPMTTVSRLLTVAALALMMLAGLPERAASMMILSYDTLPAGHFPEVDALRQWGVQQMASGFALAFTLSAPFVIAALLANIAMGAVNRAMPQLMVVMIGAPGMALGALVLIAIVVPLGLGLWMRMFLALLADPFGAGG